MATDDKPKSQPSVRHALDDVLQSLQDLVRNELSADAPAPPPAAPKQRPTPAPTTAPQNIPVLTDLIQATARPTKTSPGGVQAELPLGDVTEISDEIPVLQHVVVPPARAAAGRARAVAIDLVARIDGLLREAGNPALDPAMIARLEQLLRDALEAWAAAPSDSPKRR